jgi:hypothetical protein
MRGSNGEKTRFGEAGSKVNLEKAERGSALQHQEQMTLD